MEIKTASIYACLAAVIVCVAGMAVLTLDPDNGDNRGETKYPLGDSDAKLFRDAGVGTTYVMTITGYDHLNTYHEGNKVGSDRDAVTGTDTITVTAADADTFTYDERIVLQDHGKTIVREYKDITVNRSDVKMFPDLTPLYENSLPSPSADVGDRWGSHHLECDNYRWIHSGTEYFLCYYMGADDQVCYQVTEEYTVNNTSNGEGTESSYRLIYVLESMDFVKHA